MAFTLDDLKNEQSLTLHIKGLTANGTGANIQHNIDGFYLDSNGTVVAKVVNGKIYQPLDSITDANALTNGNEGVHIEIASDLTSKDQILTENLTYKNAEGLDPIGISKPEIYHENFSSSLIDDPRSNINIFDVDANNIICEGNITNREGDLIASIKDGYIIDKNGVHTGLKFDEIPSEVDVANLNILDLKVVNYDGSVTQLTESEVNTQVASNLTTNILEASFEEVLLVAGGALALIAAISYFFVGRNNKHDHNRKSEEAAEEADKSASRDEGVPGYAR